MTGRRTAAGAIVLAGVLVMAALVQGNSEEPVIVNWIYHPSMLVESAVSDSLGERVFAVGSRRVGSECNLEGPRDCRTVRMLQTLSVEGTRVSLSDEVELDGRRRALFAGNSALWLVGSKDIVMYDVSRGNPRAVRRAELASLLETGDEGWVGTTVVDASLESGLALVGRGRALAAMDITDPMQPVVLWRMDVGDACARADTDECGIGSVGFDGSADFGSLAMIDGTVYRFPTARDKRPTLTRWVSLGALESQRVTMGDGVLVECGSQARVWWFDGGPARPFFDVDVDGRCFALAVSSGGVAYLDRTKLSLFSFDSSGLQRHADLPIGAITGDETTSESLRLFVTQSPDHYLIGGRTLALVHAL